MKIHFKIHNDSKSTIIEESGEKTLRNVLEKLSNKNRINYKNFDLYFFVEHSENSNQDNDDMDNAINLDSQLKYLNQYELDVKTCLTCLVIFQKVSRRSRIKKFL